MMKLASFREKRSKLLWVTMGIAFVILLGIIDYLTGYEISVSLFYLVPIFLVVWYADGRMGLVLSFASAITWLIADYSAGLFYSHPSIYVWNTLLRLGFYIVITGLGSTLKRSYKVNQDLARTDYVTGAASVRYFYELAQTEMNRSQRYQHPITLAYIDLDNFKAINDQLGHSTGDRLLRTVTECVRRQVRPTDTIARLGGDEFGLLMPETGEEAAQTVMNRLHSCLADEMLKNGWTVTFSVGVVTCHEIPKSVDDMVRIADAAMYTVKNTTKNGVSYSIIPG
jgi:diguanylate cyclase (GGDEF)-like protein